MPTDVKYLTMKPPEQWKIEDFEGEEPYKWIWQHKDNRFLMQQTLSAMEKVAKSLGFREFKAYWKAYVESNSPKVTILGDYDTNFPGQPTQLSAGKYMCDEDGVQYLNELGGIVEVISHPIMPVRRVTNIETYEEKLEIAYCRGRDPWKSLTVSREQLASSQKIIGLSKQGVDVNSENAKEVVKYMSRLESLNYDQLPRQNSVSHMGWLADGKFMPYVDNVTYDGDSVEFQRMYEEFKQTGNEQKWMEIVKSVREGDSVPARIALAASFASPLAHILGCLPFFVHFWGETGCGKTVALMLAASVWGNPDVGRYIKTFSGTKVSMELYASFCCNLPVLFDELQVISDRKIFDDLIYMLTEGSSKGRGAKEGGLQLQRKWECSIITTGEMPIIQNNSGGGAVSRTIDVNYGGIPLFRNGRQVANTLRKNYGFAGPKFVKSLQKEGMTEALTALYNKIYNDMMKEDVNEKQVISASLILTADILATKAIFKDNRALTFDDIKGYLASRSDTDVNLRCYNWLIGHCAANPRRFDSQDNNSGELWGRYKDGYVFINKTVFESLLKNNGYSYGAFVDWARRKDLLKCQFYGKGNKNNRPTWPVYINKKQVAHVALKLPEEEKTEQEAYKDYVQVVDADLPF